MDQNTNSKKFDLEERTFDFAKRVRDFTKKIPSSISNYEYMRQIIRSSGSVAANYIEANESLSRKDYILRVKICRKETKETRLWLKLIEEKSEDSLEKEALIDEAGQLMRIFGTIIEKSK